MVIDFELFVEEIDSVWDLLMFASLRLYCDVDILEPLLDGNFWNLWLLVLVLWVFRLLVILELMFVVL